MSEGLLGNLGGGMVRSMRGLGCFSPVVALVEIALVVVVVVVLVVFVVVFVVVVFCLLPPLGALGLAWGRPETSLGAPWGSLGALRGSKVLLEWVWGKCLGGQMVPRGLLGDPLRDSGPSFAGPCGTLGLP